MRKLIYLLLFFNSVVFAQTNGITYQAVIYYPNGQNVPGVNIQNSPMANRPVCLEFSLLDNLSQLEYQETIQTTTDAYGIVNLVIGSGNQTGGYASSFNAVVWNTTTKTLKVQLDPTASCQQFILLSDKPLSSVPFAYASVTANNVSGVVAIQNGGTGATNVLDAKNNLGLGNVDNTSDLNKPISTATQTALDTKENTSNKSTTTTLGTSDVLFPTQNAVKTYVDTQVAAATIPDATTTLKGKIQLAGDLGGTAAAPTVPGLATKENTIVAGTTSQYYRGDKTWQTLDKTAVGLGNVDNTSDLNKPISTATQTALNAKENTSNKSTTTTLGTSDVLFPTQNAVKTYVDTQVAAATIPDATTTLKGKIQLAGDLGGTAAAPTVPGLANKENTIVAGTTSQYYRGDKTWQTLDKTAVGLGNVDNTSDLNKPISTATQTALDTKENTSNKSTTTTLGTSDVLFPTQNAVKTYVDTQVAAATIPDATTTLKGKIQLAGDLGGTAAAPTVPGLANKENTANKSTATTLGTSDVLFPTQNAVKTYVDTNITTVNANNTALQATVTANATAATNAIAAVQADVDANEATSVAADTALQNNITTLQNTVATNATNTTAALALKEDASNKSTTTVLGTSDVLFPTQNAVKTYVDTQVAAATIPDATTTLKGKIQLAGDLGGTAAAPTVPGLATKENTIVAGTTSQYYRGDKTWQTLDKTAVGLGNVDNTSDLNKPISTATQTTLDTKENTSNKSLDVNTDGTSDVKFPSVKAVKDYVDTQIASGVVDATTTVKGKIQLAGDLTGTAASPEVATGVITTAKLAPNAVTSAKILDGTIVVGDLADNAVETAKIKDANVTNAKLDKANIPLSGFGVAAADVDLGSNKLTNVTDPTAAQDAATKNYVDTTIASNATPDATTTVKGKLQLAGDLTGTAASPAVATGAITTAKLAADAVTSAKITDGTIVVGDLADNAVETAKIKDANVTNAKLANDAVETAKIKNANVTDAKLDKANIPLSGFGAAAADVDLGSNKLTNVTDPMAAQDAATKNYVDTATSSITTLTDGKIYVGNASNEATQVTPSGDVTITNAGVTAIGTGKVVTAMLATDAVETAKIKNANVTTAKLADNAVETAKIKDANVTDAKLDKANIPLSGFGAAAADVDLGSNKLTNVTDPTAAQDAATKNYVDTATSSITTLTDGKIYVGNASNEATQVTPSGDVTITNAGVTAIGTGKVVTAMLATDAVETAKIKNANVTTAKLADNAVETAKIKDANVTDAKLDKANIPLSGFGAAAADVDLGSNKLTNVTDPTAAQDAATKNYVDTATSSITTLTDGKIYVGNASNEATQVTPSGDVTITNAGVTAIGTGKVVTAMLATDAVETAKIKNANVTTAKLADNAVETAKIKDANVTDAKLDKANIPLSGFGAAAADVALGSNKLTGVADPTAAQDAATKNYVDTATSSITTLTDGKIYVGNASNEATQVTPSGDVTITNAGVTAIGNSKVVTAMLADTAVTTAKITDANVTTAKLAADAVTSAKIKDGEIVNADISASAAIVDTKLATIATSGKVSNSATTATDTNTASAIVARDANGDFSAGTITADLSGNATTATTATHLAGGASGSMPYQTAAGTTTMLAKGTNGQVLTLAGGLPSWASPAGITTLAAIGSTPNANGATISGSTLNLEPANGTNGGVVSTAAQTFGGAKTFTSVITVAPTASSTLDGAAMSIAGQSTTAASKVGGVIGLTAGNGGSNGVGGAINLTGGTGGTNANGGDINITGGTAGAANSTGGNIKLTPGGFSTTTSGTVSIVGSDLFVNNWNFRVGMGRNYLSTNTAVGIGTLQASGLSGGSNVAMGMSSLTANTTGAGNTALGTSSLFTNLDGNFNTAVGNNSLNKNESGGNNVAIGYRALQANTTGINNVGVGSNAISEGNTTTSNNVGIGYYAMRYNNGNNNIAVGYYAGGGLGYNSSTAGGNNVFIGHQAGYSAGPSTGSSFNTTGSNSVMIGYDVRPAATGETNQIVISGYNGTASAVGQGTNTTSIGNSATTRAVIYGSTSLSNLSPTASSGNGGDFTLKAQDGFTTGNTNGGNINLTPGTANGTGAAGIVKVNGQIQITGGTPGAGEVLVSDANGLASWSNAVGTTVVTNSTTYAITTAEAFVFYNGSANAAFTIPAASSTNQGKAITIKNKTGFGITITPASGTIYIDNANTGAANVSIGIEASNNWIKLVSDGTQWNVMRALF